MSQFILDEQLGAIEIQTPLRKRVRLRRLIDIRPGERILDDRIPEILLSLRMPTFLTIDHGFWDSAWCHPKYCILFFPLNEQEQVKLPGLLLAQLKLPEFQTRAKRMGKVARVAPKNIRFWEVSSQELHHVDWKEK